MEVLRLSDAENDRPRTVHHVADASRDGTQDLRADRAEPKDRTAIPRAATGPDWWWRLGITAPLLGVWIHCVQSVEDGAGVHAQLRPVLVARVHSMQ